MKKFKGLAPMKDAPTPPKERKLKPPGESNAGRPVLVKDGTRVNVHLGREHLDRALAIGNGNVSAGIRIAIMQYRTRLANQDPVE